MALMQMISFALLSPAGVTLPSPVAIEHPVWNAHTSWMIPTITLKTLHILLLVIWHSLQLSIPTWAWKENYCPVYFSFLSSNFLSRRNVSHTTEVMRA